MKHTIIALLLCLPLCSCSTSGLRTKGGIAKRTSATGATSETVQSENPKQATATDSKSAIREELLLPAGTPVEFTSTEHDPKTKLSKTNSWKIVMAQPSSFKRDITDESVTKQGGAFADTVGEVVAKMGAARPLQLAGVAMLMIGAFLFTPYGRVATGGSTTTPWVVIGAGAAVVALPFLLVGNEKLIIILAVFVVGVPIAWIIAHRHGEHKAKATIYKDFIDKNKNGIDDREEPAK